jgi:hypothetical protein
MVYVVGELALDAKFLLLLVKPTIMLSLQVGCCLAKTAI